MNSLLKEISDLNDLALSCKAKSFDKYYHQEVVMQENNNESTAGKALDRKREEELFSSVTEFRHARPLKLTVGKGLTMVQWQYDYTHKGWGIQNYMQVSVQEWQNGKIIKEQFF